MKLLEWYTRQWSEDTPGAIILLSIPMILIAGVIMLILLFKLILVLLGLFVLSVALGFLMVFAWGEHD